MPRVAMAAEAEDRDRRRAPCVARSPTAYEQAGQKHGRTIPLATLRILHLWHGQPYGNAPSWPEPWIVLSGFKAQILTNSKSVSLKPLSQRDAARETLGL